MPEADAARSVEPGTRIVWAPVNELIRHCKNLNLQFGYRHPSGDTGYSTHLADLSVLQNK